LPAVNPITVTGLAVPVALPVEPPSDDVQVTAKFVMTAPLLLRFMNDTLICPAETLTAVTFVGATGAPTVTGVVGADAGPTPRAFVAVAVHV